MSIADTERLFTLEEAPLDMTKVVADLPNMDEHAAREAIAAAELAHLNRSQMVVGGVIDTEVYKTEAEKAGRADQRLKMIGDKCLKGSYASSSYSNH